MALFGATLNALNWAFRMDNVFSPRIVRFFAAGFTPLLAPVLKLVFRAFQSPPEVSLDEWLAGMGRLSRLMANRSFLRQAWVDGDRSVTPIEDYIELWAEIFVILESDRCISSV